MRRSPREWLAILISEDGVLRLKNLSEIGYVSTQELVALFQELQAGYRPDVVIFYDGVNDTTSALLEREAGLTTNEVNRRRGVQPPAIAGTAHVGLDLQAREGFGVVPVRTGCPATVQR